LQQAKEKALKTASLVNNARYPEKKDYAGDNPEAEKALKSLHIKEYELSKILAKIPKDT